MQGVLYEPSPPIRTVAAGADVGQEWEAYSLSLTSGRDPFQSRTFEFFELERDDTARTIAAVEHARHMPGVSFVMDSFVHVGDHATPRHSAAVAILATAAVIRAGASDEVAVDAAATGFVHDAGKLYRQDYIHVERKLTDNEFEYTKWHVVDTVLLAQRLGLSCRIQYPAGNHHGYGRRIYAAFPERLWWPETQSEIEPLSDEHLIGTALASADVYEASRSGRPERKVPRSHPDSMVWVDELRTPDQVKQVFGDMFGRYCGVQQRIPAPRLAA